MHNSALLSDTTGPFESKGNEFVTLSKKIIFAGNYAKRGHFY